MQRLSASSSTCSSVQLNWLEAWAGSEKLFIGSLQTPQCKITLASLMITSHCLQIHLQTKISKNCCEHLCNSTFPFHPQVYNLPFVICLRQLSCDSIHHFTFKVFLSLETFTYMSLLSA